jgi:hypothetical protein
MSCVLLAALLTKDFDFILKTGEDHGYKRRPRLHCSMWSQPIEQRPDFSLGLQIALPIILFGHFEAHFHPLDQLLWSFFGSWLLELGVLLLSGLVELHSLGDVEGV